MMSLLKHSSLLQHWIGSCGASVLEGGGWFLVTTTSGWERAVPRTPDQLSSLLASGRKLKDSMTTTAVAVDLPGGQKMFLKRTNNKSLRFTLRYLFRPARVFRAAAGADRLQALGIPTPEVWLAGEFRCAGILKAGYLATGLLTAAVPVSAYLAGLLTGPGASTALAGEVSAVLTAAGRYAARLHGAGLVHGDLKLPNFYRCPPETAGAREEAAGSCYGLWDLDGMRFYASASQVPESFRARELARILSSLVLTLTRPAPGAELMNPRSAVFAILRDAEPALRAAYTAALPPGLPCPSGAAVAAEFRRRWPGAWSIWQQLKTTVQ